MHSKKKLLLLLILKNTSAKRSIFPEVSLLWKAYLWDEFQNMTLTTEQYFSLHQMNHWKARPQILPYASQESLYCLIFVPKQPKLTLLTFWHLACFLFPTTCISAPGPYVNITLIYKCNSSHLVNVSSSSCLCLIIITVFMSSPFIVLQQQGLCLAIQNHRNTPFE